MKQIGNNGKERENQYRQSFDDSIIIAYLTMVQIQPSINNQLIFLIKAKGTSPSRFRNNPESGYRLSPDIQTVVTKWSNIKN